MVVEAKEISELVSRNETNADYTLLKQNFITQMPVDQKFLDVQKVELEK